MSHMAVSAVALALLHAAPGIGAEQRIEGTVVDMKVTYCEAAKSAGCTGDITLQTSANGASHMLTIKVPLGTPITQDCQAVPLHSLGGKAVIVTETGQRAAPRASAITVPDSMDITC